MTGYLFDGKGRVYSAFMDDVGNCFAAVFNRSYGYLRLTEHGDALPLRSDLESAQIDLDHYAQTHGLRPADILAVRYSVHEGPTPEVLKLYDVTSGTPVRFGFSQLVEPGVVYVSNRVPGAVEVPGIGRAGDTFYLVGEGDEAGDWRDIGLTAQRRWIEILEEVHARGHDGTRAG